jgi:hypothetical protein
MLVATTSNGKASSFVSTPTRTLDPTPATVYHPDACCDSPHLLIIQFFAAPCLMHGATVSTCKAINFSQLHDWIRGDSEHFQNILFIRSSMIDACDDRLHL